MDDLFVAPRWGFQYDVPPGLLALHRSQKKSLRSKLERRLSKLEVFVIAPLRDARWNHSGDERSACNRRKQACRGPL